MSAATTQAPLRGLDTLRAAAANGQVRPPQRPDQIRAPSSAHQTTVAPEASLPSISVGFGDLASWEFTQRVARALSCSTMVPEAYRQMIPNPRKRGELVDNPNAISNCIVALNMAKRMNADPLMIMQNLYIVEGRPSWSAQFVISVINNSKLFSSRLNFQFKDLGEKIVDYTTYVWSDEERRKIPTSSRVPIKDRSCVAWAIDAATGERVEGPTVSIELAVKEGWYTRNGSKWQTMPENMLIYRAASFFGRVHTPELLMGLRTQDEAMDILEAEMAEDGSWRVAGGEQQPEATPSPATEQEQDEESPKGQTQSNEAGDSSEADSEVAGAPETGKSAAASREDARDRDAETAAAPASEKTRSASQKKPQPALDLDDGFGPVE